MTNRITGELQKQGHDKQDHRRVTETGTGQIGSQESYRDRDRTNRIKGELQGQGHDEKDHRRVTETGT